MGQSLLMVFLGGGIGSLCRYLLSNLNSSNQLPIGTILANALACLILGYFAARSQHLQSAHPLLMLLFATGFCGGFSTFSTYLLESVLLSKNGLLSLAMLNIIASLIIGLLAIVAGMKLFSFLNA